jgi:hypothetical protein
MFRAAVRRGFVVIAALSRSQVEKLPGALLRMMATSGPLPESEVRSLFENVSAEDAKAAMSAGSILAVGIGSTDEGVDQIITEAVSAKIIAEADAPGIRQFAVLLARDRDQFKRALEKQRLAGSVLPSLTAFDTLVDLRPSFNQNRLDFAVPVILFHIDTDATGQEIWFQATKGQLENMVKELNEAMGRVEETERFVNRSLSPPT